MRLYVFDAKKNMAAEFSEEGTPRPRGWGRIQYLDNPNQTYMTWHYWFVKTTAGVTDPDEVLANLNG